MSITGSEIEIAQKQLKKWAKFEKQWPYMRWATLVLALIMAFAGVFSYMSIDKLKNINENIDNIYLLGTDITPSDISSYCNTRADLLRAETRIYIGSILQLIVSASLFGFSLGGWNRHKYIKLKAKTIKLLLETQAKNSS